MTPEEREAFDVLKTKLTTTLEGYQSTIKSWQTVAEEWKSLFLKLQVVCEKQNSIIEMYKDQLAIYREGNTN